MDVLAVAFGGTPSLDAAIAAQGAARARAERAAGLAEAVERGLASGCAWLWLLDGSALPAPDALARLLEASGGIRGGEAPVLLASQVVDSRGVAVAGLAPWYRRGPSDLAMRAVTARMLPIRAARAGSLLVRVAAVAEPPRPLLSSSAAALEWSARLLRASHGFLVTASLATASQPSRAAAEALDPDPLEDVRGGVAMLLGGAMHPRERLWLAAEVGDRAWRAAREGRTSPRRLLASAAAGARRG